MPSDKMSHTCMAWTEPLIVLVGCHSHGFRSNQSDKGTEMAWNRFTFSCGSAPVVEAQSTPGRALWCAYSLSISYLNAFDVVLYVEAQCYIVQYGSRLMLWIQDTWCEAVEAHYCITNMRLGWIDQAVVQRTVIRMRTTCVQREVQHSNQATPVYTVYTNTIPSLIYIMLVFA